MARMAQLRNSLPGIALSGEHEPSSALLDMCFHQAFHEALAYIPWNECTSRSHEVLHIKKDANVQKSFKTDREGWLKAVDDEDKFYTD
eukprot:4786225-Amphidinium_carterae.1